MSEARIIPIKAEPAKAPEAQPDEKAAPRPRKRANATKADSATAGVRGTGKRRGAAARKQPIASAADAPKPPIVQPPEDLRDLGTFVREPRPEPAAGRSVPIVSAVAPPNGAGPQRRAGGATAAGDGGEPRDGAQPRGRARATGAAPPQAGGGDATTATGPRSPDTGNAQAGGAPDGRPAPAQAASGQGASGQGASEQAASGQAANDRPAADQPGDPWERRVAGALAFVRRRLTGDYEIDEFGFDPELTTTVLAAPVRPIYEKWFRVEVSGMEHVPDTGAALIVANHSGTIALDGVITTLALLDHHPARRHLRMLGADLVFTTPFLGELARKAGTTLACQADAERLLSSGELVGVYPEGFKGVGKPFSERYKLQRFGRGGFVSAALKTGAPIIPCSIVGAEEIYPMLGNAKLLARLLGVPYFPLTPTFPWLGPLGMIPLPSKWYIEFGEPIDTAPLSDRADDPMLVFNVADQVRETIQQTLYRLLMNRKSVFS